MICVLVASVFILLPCALSLAAAHLVLVRVAPEAMCFSSVRKFESQRAAAGRETRSEQLSVDLNSHGRQIGKAEQWMQGLTYKRVQ